MVLNTLGKVSQEGVEKEQIEAVLHQLELSQREIGGDHYPFGLQLILSGLSTAIHRGDVIAHMNLDSALENLRNKAQDPDYIKQLVKKFEATPGGTAGAHIIFKSNRGQRWIL